MNTQKIDQDFKTLNKKTQNLINKYNRSVDSIRSQELAISKVKNKLDDLINGNKTPISVKNLEKELKSAEKELQKLQMEYDNFGNKINPKVNELEMELSMGDLKDNKKIESLKAEISVLDKESINLSEKLESARTKAEKLKDSLKEAKLNVNSSKEVQELENKMSLLNSKLVQTKKEANQTKNALNEAFNQKKSLLDIGPKIDDIGKKIDKFKSRITNLVGAIAVFTLFRETLNKLRDGFVSLLKTNDTFSSSLNQIKANLMTAFAPIYNAVLPAINALMSALVQVTGAIATFVASIFGISLSDATNQAKDLSKSLDKTAKKGKEVSGSLASFDKLEVIGNNNSNSSDGSNTPSIDYSKPITASSKLLDFLNKIKKVFSQIFDPFKKAWETTGSTVIKSFRGALSGLKELGKEVFGSILEVWTNGTGQKIIENILKELSYIFDIIGGISKAFANAWKNDGNGTKIIQSIADIFLDIQRLVNSILKSLKNWVLSENFQKALDFIVKLVKDLLLYINEICDWAVSVYETYLAPVVDQILDCISKIILAIEAIYDFIKPVLDAVIKAIMDFLEPLIRDFQKVASGIIEAIKGILDFIIGIFTNDWETAWNGIKGILSGLIEAILGILAGWFDHIIGLFKNAFEIVKSIWSVLSSWFYNMIIKPISNFFAGLWEGIKNGAQNAWNGIKSVFSTVVSFFKNIFTNAWTAVKNVFSVGGKIFDGIKDGVINGFKAIVNAIIRGINKIVEIPFTGINKALTTIRNISFLGISPFKGIIKNIGVPRIPELAEGTVIPPRQKFMAILGDQRHGTNIEAPLETIKQANREVFQEFMGMLLSMNNNDREIVFKNLTIVAQFGNKDFSKIVVEAIRMAEKELGKQLLVS